MAHLTTLDELKEHITLLASVEESEAPFISCYLNLEDGETSWRKALDKRACILRRILKGNDLADLEESLDKIEVRARGRQRLAARPQLCMQYTDMMGFTNRRTHPGTKANWWVRNRR